MTTVLSCVPETVDHRTAAADGTSALDDSFWSIAAAVDTRPLRASMVVGTDPDNHATNPYTAPTTPRPPVTNRLRQLTDLHHHQLINDDEYTRQRARILNEL